VPAVATEQGGEAGGEAGMAADFDDDGLHVVRPSAGPTGRRKALLDYILPLGSAQVDELADHFGVSRMTVHRDLKILEEQGIVRRVHGGVTVRPSNLVDSTILYRSRLADREKDALARAAVDLVEPGQAIILDDSTTALRVAGELVTRQPLTVITNSLTVVDKLKESRGIETICLGGHYNPRFNGFFGYVCEQSVASLRANILFMSTSTVLGATAYHQQEEVVKTKRALMEAADKRILLIDSSKFGKTALIKLAALSEFDLVMTDSGIAASDAEALRKAGVELRVVEV
jgi:DeoR/GlpR family transcriptional regulator of sugar metabolism